MGYLIFVFDLIGDGLLEEEHLISLNLVDSLWHNILENVDLINSITKMPSVINYQELGSSVAVKRRTAACRLNVSSQRKLIVYIHPDQQRYSVFDAECFA